MLKVKSQELEGSGQLLKLTPVQQHLSCLGSGPRWPIFSIFMILVVYLIRRFMSQWINFSIELDQTTTVMD